MFVGKRKVSATCIGVLEATGPRNFWFTEFMQKRSIVAPQLCMEMEDANPCVFKINFRFFSFGSTHSLSTEFLQITSNNENVEGFPRHTGNRGTFCLLENVKRGEKKWRMTLKYHSVCADIYITDGSPVCRLLSRILRTTLGALLHFLWVF